MKKTVKAASAAVVAIMAAVAFGFGAMAEKPAEQPAAQPGNPAADMGKMLIEGLKASPGCLGVETAQTSSRKNVIIAWFKDAPAARQWYYNPVHQRMMGTVEGANDDKQPLEHVPDKVPVMVMASITFSDKPEIEGIPMPIKQIAIELYTPLPGGAAVGGRMAPDTFPVKHMNGYPEPVEEADADS